MEYEEFVLKCPDERHKKEMEEFLDLLLDICKDVVPDGKLINLRSMKTGSQDEQKLVYLAFIVTLKLAKYLVKGGSTIYVRSRMDVLFKLGDYEDTSDSRYTFAVTACTLEEGIKILSKYIPRFEQLKFIAFATHPSQSKRNVEDKKLQCIEGIVVGSIVNNDRVDCFTGNLLEDQRAE
mmetsp:Transcript_33842/g.82036  ORF Transcript_33842/g.82036 Transcript_33842/m.82036 type:complete len:179 (-) Transcript_33842:608-1144(-)